MKWHELFSELLTPFSPLPTEISTQCRLRENVEVVLFDIYGTLFQSAAGDINVTQGVDSKSDRLKQMLAKYNLDLTSEILVSSYRNRIRQEHRLLRQKGIDYPEVRIDEVWSEVLKEADIETCRTFALEFELITNPVWPMPMLLETLTGLRKKGFRLGIISNAQFYTPWLFKWFCKKDTETLGFDPDLTLYSYQWRVAKPSMKLFQIAAERLDFRGIPPFRVLYVGNDMLKDMIPAAGAGFQTALFAGDKRSFRPGIAESTDLDFSPVLTITELIQLLDLPQPA